MGQSKFFAVSVATAILALVISGGLVLPEGMGARAWDGTASAKEKDDATNSGTRVVVRLDPFPSKPAIERDDAIAPDPAAGLWQPTPAMEPAAPPDQDFAAMSAVSLAQIGEDTLPALTLAFSSAGESLDAAMRGTLDRLAAELNLTGERIQLLGYATPSAESLTTAKRLALRRAVAVRKYLVEQGIAQTRIDVRAIGAAKTGAPDRVDIVRPNG
ncbi:MAG: OmpA family protein [Alphaproteobacteria bacterium]|nr:OmpA family protein [Alphaproteobacteria bacterium]